MAAAALIAQVLARRSSIGARRALLGIAMAGLSVAGCSPAGVAADTAGGDGSIAAAERGRSISAQQAGVDEERLVRDPGNVVTHEELVGYYFESEMRAPATPGADPAGAAPRVARHRHLVWLVEHQPDVELLGQTLYGVVHPEPDGPGFAAATSAWAHVLARGQLTAGALGNAGTFFAQTYDPRAEDLLRRAAQSDPANAQWPLELGDFYSHRSHSAPWESPEATAAAGLAVGQMEKAWRLSGASDRDARLLSMAKLAAEAHQDERAADYANRAIRAHPADPSQEPLTYGNAIHDGNVVLGRVAFRRGDRAAAADFLLKAAATPGSPQLSRGGPNVSLARDLLEAGSTAAVMQYLERVGKFWSDPRVEEWKAEVAAGKTPDFGSNLWA